MEVCSDIESGKIVAARLQIEGLEFAVVAVGPEIMENRILAAKTIRYYGNRLFDGLPVLLAGKDTLGRTRFIGNTMAEKLQDTEPALDWKTLYEDGPPKAEPAA